MVDELASPLFDFAYVSKLVLAKSWKSATETQRNEFAVEFKRLLIITYATALFQYTGEEKMTFVGSDLKERKILTLYRDGTFFNTFVAGPLGVICEEVNSESITDLNSYNVKENLDLDAFYQQFEVFKKPGHTAFLINTFPTILASFAPPLWMIQNRLWNFFGISLVFFFVLMMISPWLFFVGWILMS